jgi:hypothetical protein
VLKWGEHVHFSSHRHFAPIGSSFGGFIARILQQLPQTRQFKKMTGTGFRVYFYLAYLGQISDTWFAPRLTIY